MQEAGAGVRDVRAMAALILTFFALFAFILLPIPQYATDQAFSGYTQVPPGAPIRINACEGSQEKIRGVVANSTIEYGAAFTILGKRTARRVRLRFAFDDRSWHPVRTSESLISGSFAPGARISRTRRIGGGFRERGLAKEAVAVVCAPEEIDFFDGSVWRYSNAPATPSSVSALD
jgi:hypothetical protein